MKNLENHRPTTSVHVDSSTDVIVDDHLDKNVILCRFLQYSLVNSTARREVREPPTSVQVDLRTTECDSPLSIPATM